MKFLNSTELVAEFALTTPMFLGDADQQTDTQLLRNASFKGALRFWWRALQWGPLRAASADDKAALIALHQQEAALFGSASNEKSQQSLFSLRSHLRGAKEIEIGSSGDNLSYALGLGLFSINDRGRAGRKGVQSRGMRGGSVTVQIVFKPNATAEQIAQLKNALMALGFLGGLGSRARKGLGSLALQQLAVNGKVEQFESIAALEAFVSQIHCQAPAQAPLSAFTRSTRIDVSATGTNPEALLRQVMDEQHRYRDGTVQNQREKNFSGDRELALSAARGNRIDSLPKRTVFGMPHNYFWKNSNDKLDISPQESTRNRRASPLITHIHQFPNGQCVAVNTLLATRFLPENTPIKLKGKRDGTFNFIEIDYAPIHTFLNRFESRKVLLNG